MASIVLGCDVNNGNDKTFQDTIAKMLEKNGHTVKKLAISPTPFGNYGYTSEAKGKIGIYLMAGSLVSVTDVASDGWNFKYTYFGIRGDASRTIKTENDFKTKGIRKDHHGDCTNKFCDAWQGKTYPQINEIIKAKGLVLFGKTPQEMGESLVQLLGGGTDSSSSGSEEGEGDSGGGNVKDCVQKLLKHWDGDVECVIRGKNVYINRVRDPESYYSCALFEGVNVFLDNITVTDVNPNTPNHLIVEWTGGSIEFRDEVLIFRFGERLKTMTAVKKVVTYVKETSNDDSSDGSSDSSDGSSDGSGDGSSDSSDGSSSDSGSSGSSSGSSENNGQYDIDSQSYYDPAKFMQ